MWHVFFFTFYSEAFFRDFTHSMLLLQNFNHNSNLYTDVNKYRHYKFSRKTELFSADMQKEIHGEANSRFSHYLLRKRPHYKN